MTVDEFNAKFEQFEGKTPDKQTISQIIEVIAENGLEVVEPDMPDDFSEDGLYEIRVQFKDKPLEFPYGFGICIDVYGNIAGCEIWEEDWV